MWGFLVRILWVNSDCVVMTLLLVVVYVLPLPQKGGGFYWSENYLFIYNGPIANTPGVGTEKFVGCILDGCAYGVVRAPCTSLVDNFKSHLFG